MQLSATSSLVFIPASRTVELPARNVALVIGREEGEALERLGHAIEYLEDELVAPAGGSFANRELLDGCEAIETIKKLHRELWYSLPLRVSLWRRALQWFHPPARVITLPTA